VFIGFFVKLREARVPVTLREYLGLLEGLQAGIAGTDVEDFYYLARATLVKDERNYDRFDRAFGEFFKGIEQLTEALFADIPDEWLRREIERLLTPEERAALETLGLDALLEALRERLRTQDARHQGGKKMIGTGGSSPFGAFGDHPEAIRIGQDDGRRRSAVKVWDRREYKNLDDSVVIGTRNIKVALRRLRRFVREGADCELDLPATVKATADNGGWLDLHMRPERHNKVKVLLFLDVGGSMTIHARTCEELFSAARAEFKHLEYFYFHNCVYETVWRDNSRRQAERVPTWEVLHTYPSDYKLVLVGDASMSPYELSHPGGSVEHWNDEPGHLWLRRLLQVYPSAIWLNPEPADGWDYTHSIGQVRALMDGRMFPLTLEGLERGMRLLARK
jgi:uncharacterized protein with von Willebrand factor type A (vWA) domain